MKRYLTILIPIIALLAVIGWRFAAKRKEKAEQTRAANARKNAPPGVRITQVVQRDIVHTFEGVGSAESPFNVRISPQVTGRLAFLEVREGARVRQGEVLARIDPADIQAQVSQQQANLAEAQSRLAQAAVTANATNVSVNSQIQLQRAALISARSNQTQAEQNYESQVAAAQSTVTDAQGRVDNAEAAVKNAEASIRSSQANLNNANVRYNRTYSLYKQGFVAAQDVDDARTQVQIQQAALDVAQGQRASAQAARDSALAQKRSAEEQRNIVVVKGKADIQAARATTQQANAALTTARANTAQKPAYQQNLAALRAAVSAATAQLKNAQVQLSRTTINAPLTGYITSRSVDPGMIVSPGQTLLTLQTIRQIYVTTSIPEDITRSVHSGMQAAVAFDALPDRRFTGTVSQVNPAIDPQSRQFTMRVTLDNPGNLINPGMFARVTLEIKRTRGAIVVPREAVRQDPKLGAAVATIDGQSVAHILPIKTGDCDATGLQVLQGLKPGDKVVSLTLTPVKEGQKVRTEETPASPGQPVVEGGGGAPGSGGAPATGSISGSSPNGMSGSGSTSGGVNAPEGSTPGAGGGQTPGVSAPGQNGNGNNGTQTPGLGPINPPIQGQQPGSNGSSGVPQNGGILNGNGNSNTSPTPGGGAPGGTPPGSGGNPTPAPTPGPGGSSAPSSGSGSSPSAPATPGAR